MQVMLKCGIIGCGVISGTHLAGYQAVEGAQVTAFCDLIAERAEKLAAQVPGARVYTDYRQMLADKDVECVSVCTDHASHVQIVCDAIEAGKHVICEKVPGRTPEDLEKMVRCALAHPEVVVTGVFQHRFNDKNIALRELVSRGAFGRILTVNLNFACLRTDEYYRNDAWRGTFSGEGGGVLINQAIHFLDQLRFLFGNVEKVAAVSGNLTHGEVIEVEDTAAFVAQFANGLFVTVNATNSAFAKWRSALTICGTEVQVELINEKLSYIDGEDGKTAEIRKILEAADSAEAIHGKTYYGTGHTAQLADFADAVINRRAPAVSFADAANSAALVHAVYAASASGRWEEVHNF